MPYKDPEARRAYERAYDARNREKVREYARNWKVKNHGHIREYFRQYHANRIETNLPALRLQQRAAHLSHKYRMTPAEYDALVLSQNNRCLICGEEAAEGKALQVDHDHGSGKVRGLLCGYCNRAIGQFRDDPELVDKAAAYLRRFMETS